jgi:hypothetical protein
VNYEKYVTHPAPPAPAEERSEAEGDEKRSSNVPLWHHVPLNQFGAKQASPKPAPVKPGTQRKRQAKQAALKPS